MSITFALGFLQIYCNKKAQMWKFYAYIFSEQYLPKNSAVGLFSCDKFEETPKQKVIDLSKLEKFYFSFCVLIFVEACIVKETFTKD